MGSMRPVGATRLGISEVPPRISPKADYGNFAPSIFGDYVSRML